MPTALITGTPDWVSPIAIALKSEGFEILSAAGEVPLNPGSVDCYVQLPADAAACSAPTLPEVRSMVTDDLLARVDLMTRLAPSLSPSAAVVLVADGPLRPLLEVLAGAVASERGGLRTAVVPEGPPDEIAALARRTGRSPSWRSYLEVDPELAFTDWRDAIFCLTSAGGGASG